MKSIMCLNEKSITNTNCNNDGSYHYYGGTALEFRP